jgi:hypothetical protein
MTARRQAACLDTIGVLLGVALAACVCGVRAAAGWRPLSGVCVLALTRVRDARRGTGGAR